MREILFKAKRLDNGEWVEGYYVFFKETILGDNLHVIFYGTNFNEWCEIDPSTLCQYTGKTDKNGVKIFECDRVCDPYERKYFSIKWDNELASFVLLDNEGWSCRDIIKLTYCEVIGNIKDKRK